MRWEDEKYVRLYTRDTVDWLGLSFIAQGLFCLILRKVDRAGILSLGKHGRRAVAIAVGFPGEWSRLEPALDELLTDGCVRIEGDHLLVPNFIEAQEANQSDAARKRAQRERARARVTGRDVDPSPVSSPRDIPSQNVTSSHGTGQKVTSGHTESHAVTLSCAVPCLAVPEEASLSPAREAPPPEPTGRLSPLPRPDERAAQLYPATTALLAALDARGEVVGAPAKASRGTVERAIASVGVDVACDRLMADFAAHPTTKRWLGFKLDVILGRPLTGNGHAVTLPAPAEEWLSSLGPRRTEAESEWTSAAERIRRAAYPDALPRLLAAELTALVERYSEGNA